MSPTEAAAGRDGRVVRVVMVPWLAHGHISPFLELAKRLTTISNKTSTGVEIVVHLCSSSVNLQSVDEQLDQQAFPRIELADLELPSLPELPPQLHTTKHLPPQLMDSLKEAFDKSAPSLQRLLERLRPNILLYDFLLPWAPETAKRLGIPAVLFFPSGAAEMAYFTHYIIKSEEGREEEEFPLKAVSLGSHREDLAYCRSMLKRKGASGITDSERVLKCLQRSSGFVAVKTFREIEGKYMDYASQLIGKEIVPAGPLVQQQKHDDQELPTEEATRVIEWLERRDKGSVVFVSVGSEYFMMPEEIEEMARGLQLSGSAFVWVVRFPKGSGTEEEEDRLVVEKLRERVGKEKGLVVEGWAPQGRILRHRSVGAFLTHCGWSSVLEGMSCGVPMVALPLQLDQPLNAKLVTAELGLGVEVPRANGSLGKFRGEDLGKAIRRIMIEEEGEKLRRKAREMAEKIAYQGDEDARHLLDKMLNLCSTSTRSTTEDIEKITEDERRSSDRIACYS